MDLDEIRKILQEAQEQGFEPTRVPVTFYQNGMLHGSRRCGNMGKEPPRVQLRLSDLLTEREYCSQCIGMADLSDETLSLRSKIQDLKQILRIIRSTSEGTELQRYQAAGRGQSKLLTWSRATRDSRWIFQISEKLEKLRAQLLQDESEKLKEQLAEQVFEKTLNKPDMSERALEIFNQAYQKALEALRSDTHTLLVAMPSAENEAKALAQKLYGKGERILELPAIFAALQWSESILLESPLTPEKLATIRVLFKDGGVYSSLKEAYQAANEL